MNGGVLEVLRGIDFFWSHVLFGGFVFAQFVTSARSSRRLRTLCLAATGASLVWLLACAHDMVESWAPADLWKCIGQTTFGQFCGGQGILLLAMSLFYPILGARKGGRWVLLAGSQVSLVLGNLTSHAATATGNLAALGFVAESLHSIAVGVWSGGLLALFGHLAERRTEPVGHTTEVVKKFSRLAMASVAVILASGVTLGYAEGVRFEHLLANDYANLVLGKFGLYTLALAVAGVNQFVHLRSFDPTNEEQVAARVRREVGLEIVVVILLFVVAGFLTRTSPPG